MAQHRGPGSLPGDPQPGGGLRTTLTPAHEHLRPQVRLSRLPGEDALTLGKSTTTVITTMTMPPPHEHSRPEPGPPHSPVPQRGPLPPRPPTPPTPDWVPPFPSPRCGAWGVCRGSSRQEQLEARTEPGYRPLPEEEGGPSRQPGAQPSTGQGQAGGPGASLPGQQGEAICPSTCLSAPGPS